MRTHVFGASTRRMMAALGAGWISRFGRILLNLILTPVLFAGLSAEELGIWITMQSAVALLALLDFGLTSTLPRRFAFARGATDLEAERIDDAKVRARVEDLLVTGNQLYLARLLATVVIGAAAGYAILVGLDLGPSLVEEARWAWALLVLGQATQLWGAAWSSAMVGFGLSAWQISITTIVTMLGLVAQIAVVSAGYGLVALAVVVAPLPLVQRQTVIFIMRKLHPEIEPPSGRWNTMEARSMLRPSLAAWLVSLSALASFRVDHFFISAYLGAAEVPPYFASMQVYNSLHFLALAIFLGASPLLSQFWARGNVPQFRKIGLKLYRLSLFLAAAGAGTMLGLGGRLFEVWLGPGAYVGDAILALIALRLVLDTHQAALLSAARCSEFEVFTKLAIAGAILGLIFAFLLTPAFGLFGLVAANLLSQGATLHSFGALRAANRIGIQPIRGVVRVAAEAILLGVVCCAATRMGSTLLGTNLTEPRAVMGFLYIAVIIAIAATALLSSIWKIVLEASDRRQLVLYARNLCLGWR